MSSHAAIDVYYPESDGKPMGETDLHIHWMFRIRDILKWRYREHHTYVACNLLVYYQEGMPKKFLVPDVFVVKDSDPGFRRTYKLWEEGQSPDCIFEVTSLGTRREDETVKPNKYAAMGVGEYFLYDPSSEYLSPPLQGHRLVDGEYVRIEPDNQGRLFSQQLDLYLQLDERELVLHDATTGQRQLTHAEAADLAAEAKQHEVEAKQREVEAKAREVEARDIEVARLREILKRHGIDE